MFGLRSLNLVKVSIYLIADSRKFFIFAPSNLNSYRVMIQLQIQVYANLQTKLSNKRVFERIVEFNDACSIDFNGLMRALFLLFGNSCIVSFNISVK